MTLFFKKKKNTTLSGDKTITLSKVKSSVAFYLTLANAEYEL